jgi:cytochrome c-type biogenesis protein CcmE
MAQATWEKAASPQAEAKRSGLNVGRLKFLIGGLLILGAVAYLVISGTLSGAQYFMTVDQIRQNPVYVGQTVRLMGAVIGDSIQYDAKNLVIHFTVVNVPMDNGNLAADLHQAVSDTRATRMNVVVEGQVKPDLLQNEAQAIMTGTLDANGVFHASELLLKCPSRFQEAAPNQQTTGSQSGA